MPNAILGLSAYYHDSAAALVVDGQIVAAAQEERFTRVKHDHRFPTHAAEYCLREAGLRAEDLTLVAFYDRPYLKFERLLETYLAFAPVGLRSFLHAAPLWLKTKLHLPREIRRELGGGYRKKIVFTRHHESHAASAFLPSPYEEAAILTLDGVGEWDCATIGVGRGAKTELLRTLRFPHSIGLLYSAMTYFCGFRVNSGEYKLMGLAPYGVPRFADTIRRHLLDLREDGSFALDLQYFTYCEGLRMTNDRFAALFEGPPRLPESPITQREMDLAASIQVVTEEIVLRMARTARELTGCRNLCLAGGVALNCVANGKIIRSGIFDDVWIQPAAGDAGGALGAALFTHHQLLGGARQGTGRDTMRGSLLGPHFSREETRTALTTAGATFTEYQEEEPLLARVSQALADGKVVGWFHGRMEFGPRALGARSIVGDPRQPAMQAQMNLRIKFRESFRPFAPCVLEEAVNEVFEHDHPSPYMLVVAPVREKYRRELSEEEQRQQRDPDLRKRVNVARSEFPAITHVDYSARLQTVDAERHGRFHRLMKRFQADTGCPIVVNTSFNIRGEPIVGTPADAYRCLLATDMDMLVVEDFVLLREDQPPLPPEVRQRFLDSFQLD